MLLFSYFKSTNIAFSNYSCICDIGNRDLNYSYSIHSDLLKAFEKAFIQKDFFLDLITSYSFIGRYAI